MPNEEEKELSEKIKEMGYIRLNFRNKLRILESEQGSIIKKLLDKLDSQNLNKIREEIKK